MLPFEPRLKLYQAFIVPHFNYCAESWHFCIKRLTDKLEKLNERVLRFACTEITVPHTRLYQNRVELTH